MTPRAAAAAILAIAAHAAADTFTDAERREAYRDAQPRLIAPRTAPDKPPHAVRLATYNIENLFDDRDDPSLEGRFDDCYSFDKTVRAKPRAQLAAAARAIRALDADVLALQEIESYDALIDFRHSHLAGMGYDHVVSIDVGQERGIEQAVLSRFPITHARVWPNKVLDTQDPDDPGQPLRYRRSPLMATVEVPAGARNNPTPYTVNLFVVHHKSGRRHSDWRAAEARALRDILAEPGAPAGNIAVLGDFNATPDQTPVRTYLDAGFDIAFAPDDFPPTHASGRPIDFILVNPDLAQDLVPGTGFVLGTPLRPDEWDWRSTPVPFGYASDHMPVAIDLDPRRD